MAVNATRGTRPGWCLAFAILTFALIASDLTQAQSDSSHQNHWLREILLNAPPKLPLSFAYGRQSSDTLLKSWPETSETRINGERTEHSLVWTDPKTGLQLRVTAVEFAGSPVVEWTAHFKNGGKADTPILEDVQPLDLSVAVAGQGIPTIRYARGVGGMDAYSLQKRRLNQL